MISEKFRSILNDMFPSFDRTVGVLDKKLEIIASSDKTKVGQKLSDDVFDKISSSNFFIDNNVTYKYFGSKKSDEFAIFVSGSDEQAKVYANILSVAMGQITEYYLQKHSKVDFIRNLILDNLLPGELNFKIRELKIDDNVSRVCIIVKSSNRRDNTDMLQSLKEIFPDCTKDFVFTTDTKSVTVVKSLNMSSCNEESLVSLANTIVSVLSSKFSTRIYIGVGNIVKDLHDLSDSFKHAQVALLVRKVFEDDKNVALYSKLGIARLIYQLPVTLCEAFLNEVFKKCTVDSLDRDLMFTINKFFENSLNISETARHLFVHRNTLVYRIDKIKKLTGLDLKNFEDAIVFKIALMVNKYLKES